MSASGGVEREVLAADPEYRRGYRAGVLDACGIIGAAMNIRPFTPEGARRALEQIEKLVERMTND